MSMRVLTLVVAVLGCATSSDAAFVASYSFAGKAGTEASDSVTSTTGTATGVSFGDISRSADLKTNAGANSINSNSFPTAVGTAFDPTRGYYTFTVSAAAGSVLQLTQLALFVQHSATGPATIDVRSSVDGFASTLGTLNLATTNTSPTADNVTLGAAFAALTTPVEFRIFGYGGTGSSGTFRITNSGTTAGIQLAGSVTAAPAGAVPEPSSLVLVGLGLLGAGLVARRRAPR